MRTKRLHAVTILVGSIIAVAIAFSQFLAPEYFCTAEQIEVKQTGAESPDDTQSFISLPSLSLPAPIQVQGSLNSYCLFELFRENDTNNKVPADDTFRYTDRFFETLFRVIISPNAP